MPDPLGLGDRERGPSGLTLDAIVDAPQAVPQLGPAVMPPARSRGWRRWLPIASVILFLLAGAIGMLLFLGVDIGITGLTVGLVAAVIPVPLLVASFLTKTLYVDWRIGARHFLRFLVDGDLVNNQLNWQWVAGTGTDTRPHRVLNPVLQGKRYDPDGAYVRRWVPELADVSGAAVHEPWRLPQDERARLRYPAPLLDLGEGLARFRQARGRD